MTLFAMINVQWTGSGAFGSLETWTFCCHWLRHCRHHAYRVWRQSTNSEVTDGHCSWLLDCLSWLG